MKHELLIKRILTTLHESWMDDRDKTDFDAAIMRLLGTQLDADIDAGIANGCTEAQQEEIARSLLRAMKK